jgi:hypothetical protein
LQAEDLVTEECFAISFGRFRGQFWLYARLFLVMGVTYMSEFVHVLLHGDHDNIDYCNFYVEVGGLTAGDPYGRFFKRVFEATYVQKKSRLANVGALAYSD